MIGVVLYGSIGGSEVAAFSGGLAVGDQFFDVASLRALLYRSRVAGGWRPSLSSRTARRDRRWPEFLPPLRRLAKFAFVDGDVASRTRS